MMMVQQFLPVKGPIYVYFYVVVARPTAFEVMIDVQIMLTNALPPIA